LGINGGRFIDERRFIYKQVYKTVTD